MDPNNGGNQPEASLASTIASAFANFAGKSRDGEKEQEGHTLPTAANSEGPSVVAVADSNQKSMAAIDNSASMSNLDATAPTEDQVEDHSPSTDLHVENTANETQASFAKEESESKIDIGDVEMEEETESTGVEDDPTPKQLQAVVGEQTFNVKITANDEIVVDDDDTADGDGEKFSNKPMFLLCFIFTSTSITFLNKHCESIFHPQKSKESPPVPQTLMVNPWNQKIFPR